MSVPQVGHGTSGLLVRPTAAHSLEQYNLRFSKLGAPENALPQVAQVWVIVRLAPTRAQVREQNDGTRATRGDPNDFPQALQLYVGMWL